MFRDHHHYSQCVSSLEFPPKLQNSTRESIENVVLGPEVDMSGDKWHEPCSKRIEGTTHSYEVILPGKEFVRAA